MINWAAVGVIVAAVAAAAGGTAKVAAWLVARAERKAELARAELAGKLDKVGAHLASQDRQHDRLAERVGTEHRQLGERVARLEQSAQRVERAVAPNGG